MKIQRQASFDSAATHFGNEKPLAAAKHLVAGYSVDVIHGCNQVGAYAERLCNINDTDEPFYILDLGRVLQRHQLWLKHLPTVKPYYAAKCNTHPVLMSVLGQLGCNFDCASKNEIENVLGLGFSADRIIYANPCKTASYIRHAASRNVFKMTFDNEEELYKVKKLFPEAELILRISVSDPTAMCPLSLKFGSEPVEHAPALLKLADLLDLKVVGISFHVGSGCRDPTAYEQAIRHAKNLFDYGKNLGHPMHVLDIGGGFPGHDEPGVITFEDIASVVNRSIKEYFPPEMETTVIAEPGRFYAESSFTLYCNVLASTRVSAERITKEESDRDKTGFMYYINDGVYGSFNCILCDHQHPIGAPLKEKAGELFWSNVWGPTCDSLDLVIPQCKLQALHEGDWLVFHQMGAYTMAASSEFNGFPRASVHIVCSEGDLVYLQGWMQETVEDLVVGDTLPEVGVESELANCSAFFSGASDSDVSDCEYALF